jgi:hypothetical protein
MGPHCKTALLKTLFFLFLLGVTSCGSDNEEEDKTEKFGSAEISATAQSYSAIKTESAIEISGKVSFDLISFNTAGTALDFNKKIISPAKGIVVEALNRFGSIITSTTTNEKGEYSLEVIQNTDVKIRVSAKMIMTGNANWNVQVSDNTELIANKHPLYISESSLFFTSQDATKDFHLPAVSNGLKNGVSSSAPFAILDAVYDAIQTVVAVDPNITFPPLELHWSSDNSVNSGCWTDGNIGTSFYLKIIDDNTSNCLSYLDVGPYKDKIYILGRIDTDEFDRHVIIHEWGHYFEQNFSRSDSSGGAHSPYEKLDLNLAFSEGWSNALAAIVTQDTIYKDSIGNTSYESLDIESRNFQNSGWYSEASIHEIIYDIYDSDSESHDDISVGFEPIYSTLTSANFINNDYQANIYSFAEILKKQLSQPERLKVDNLMNAEQIFGVGFEASGEINDGGIESTLPIYKTIYANSGPEVLCLYNEYGTSNTLGNVKYVIFEPQLEENYLISLAIVDANKQHGFALSVIKSGSIVSLKNTDSNLDHQLNLSANKYIFRIEANPPTNFFGNYCFNLQVKTI